MIFVVILLISIVVSDLRKNTETVLCRNQIKHKKSLDCRRGNIWYTCASDFELSLVRAYGTLWEWVQLRPRHKHRSTRHAIEIF